jgi:hypothetical protein
MLAQKLAQLHREKGYRVALLGSETAGTKKCFRETESGHTNFQ